jgi:hypothetical protein
LQNLSVARSAFLGNSRLKSSKELHRSIRNTLRFAGDMAAQRWRSYARYQLDEFNQRNDQYVNLLKAFGSAMKGNVFEKLRQIAEDTPTHNTPA